MCESVENALITSTVPFSRALNFKFISSSTIFLKCREYRLDKPENPSSLSKKSVIIISGVTKTYKGKKPALEDVSLTVTGESFITIIGPSGCGKTTLLRIINGMVDFESGEINILNREKTLWDSVQLRRKIGYVIQNVGLFPHLTVKQNMQFVMSISGVPQELLDERTYELTQMIGFSKSQLDEYPDNLSGGQQQRVGLARALARSVRFEPSWAHKT